MPISDEAMRLEQLSIGMGGKPTLCAALKLLGDDWRAGVRDRELALHLNFLSWYVVVEPHWLTGCDRCDHGPLFNETHDWLLPDPIDSRDAEALFVTGLAARMFPWALGPEELWESRAAAYRARYRELMPDGISPAVFENRGAYGEYFAHHARGVGGF